VNKAMTGRILLAAAWMPALALAAHPSAAQDAPQPDPAAPPPAERTQPRQSGQVYAPEYFARFAPRSALDMLKQTPGFTIKAEDDERGLGQASGNVLINRQRLSTKSDSAEDQLARIPAGNLVRIEILDGATLDIPGLSGQIANIVTKGGGFSGQFTWEPQFPAKVADARLNKGSISGSGSAGLLDYTIAFSNTTGDVGGNGGPATIVNADGSLRENRYVTYKAFLTHPRVSTSLKFNGPGSAIANLNASYQWNRTHSLRSEDRSGPGLPDAVRKVDTLSNGHQYEIGGDFEFPLGPGRLKLIGLARGDQFDTMNEAITDFAGAAPSTGRRIFVDSRSSERIARAEYRWRMLGGDWQISGEAAFNALDNVADQFDLLPDGSFTGAPFPPGTGGVKEDRYEAILSYSRPLADRLAMQLTVGGEYSHIAQTGSNAEQRTFRRPKGSLALTWAARPGLDLSLTISRKVGQLEFADFLAEVFLDNENANAGNNQLVPQQSWETELEARKDLGEWGSATLKLFDYRIEDLVAVIPLGPDIESKGNIDKARLRGLRLTSTLRFEPIGFAGAKLNLSLLLQDSNIRDPLDQLDRPIDSTNGREIDMELRHDIPGSDWAWGVRYRNIDFGYFHRLREAGEDWGIDDLGEIYVEHKNVLGLTVQARVNNLFDSDVLYYRTVHFGPRNASPVDFVERNIRKVGPLFRFLIKGNF